MNNITNPDNNPPYKISKEEASILKRSPRSPEAKNILVDIRTKHGNKSSCIFCADKGIKASILTRKMDETIIWSTHPEQQRHHHDCALYRPIGANPGGGKVKKIPSLKNISVVENITKSGGGGSPTNGSSSGINYGDSFDRFVKQVLTDASLNNISSKKATNGSMGIQHAVNRLREGKSIKVDGTNKFSFQNGYEGLQFALESLGKFKKVLKNRPIWIIFFTFDDMVKSAQTGLISLTIHGKNEKNQCTLPAVAEEKKQFPQINGPRLGVIVLTNDPDHTPTSAKTFKPMVQTFWHHPIMSHHFPVLVDSNYERQFGLSLTKAVCDGVLYAWEKPLTPMFYDGKRLIPDFFLKIKEDVANEKEPVSSFIVELMGFSTDSYIQRKQVTTELMSHSFRKPLYEINVTNARQVSLNTGYPNVLGNINLWKQRYWQSEF